MGWVKLAIPLLFQSKLFCISLLYLLTTVPLSLYITFSQRGCLFFSPPLLSHPLFSYPSSYGEHKHALPSSTSSCSSPVFFSDYRVAFKEIQNIRNNQSLRMENSTSPVLRYLQGKDRIAMDQCDGVVVVSAIFGDHDKIRQPKGLGFKTLEAVCFFMFIDETTLKGLTSHNILFGADSDMIGVWRVIRLFAGDLPYKNPAMNGVIPKYLLHRLFPNAKFSIWIDAKLRLNVDPLLLLHALLISKDADMAVSKHPMYVHTMEEAMATARWRKWGDVESLRMQMESYCENGLEPWSSRKLPYTTGKHGRKIGSVFVEI